MIKVNGTMTGWLFVTKISAESGNIKYVRVRSDGCGYYITNRGKKIDVTDKQDRFIREENKISNFWDELVIDHKIKPEYLREEFKL